MTTLPDLEPAGLEAEIRRIVEDAMDSAITEPWEVSAHATKRILSLLTAARSALEAGKAVDWRLDLARKIVAGRAFNRPSDTPGERLVGFYVPEDVAGLSDALFALDAIRERLASVVPSGAETCRRCKGEGSVADYVGDDMRCIETGCPDCNGTGRAPQAVPAEDVAELVERAISKALGWQPSEDGPSYRETRQEVERLLAAASEAEATSLRRKLEEAERQAAHYPTIAGQNMRLREHLEEARKALEALADDLTEVKFGDQIYKRTSLSKDSIARTVAEIRRIAALTSDGGSMANRITEAMVEARRARNQGDDGHALRIESEIGDYIKTLIAAEEGSEPIGPNYWPDKLRSAAGRLAALAAALSTEPGEAEGMVLVPREPTPEMLEQFDGLSMHRITKTAATRIYLMMLAAAPLPEDTHHGR